MSVPRATLALNLFGEEASGQAVLMTPRASLGALLLGSLMCMFLSGALGAQAYLYTTMYPRDKLRIKSLVATVWLLDLLQSAMACVAMWAYLIQNFGILAIADHVIWALAVTVLLTTILTFIVQLYFASRIYSIAKRKWAVALCTALLSTGRFALGLASATDLFRTASFSAFVSQYKGLYSSAVVLTVVIDLIIVVAMLLYRKRSRPMFNGLDKTLITVNTYTVETGFWTSVVTLISVICWYAMPNNLVFLAIHIAVTKLYTNSLLANLNARRELVGRSHSSAGEELAMPVMFPQTLTGRSGLRSRNVATVDTTQTEVQLNVEKTIEHEVEYEHSDAGAGETDSGGSTEPAGAKLKMRAYEDDDDDV